MILFLIVPVVGNVIEFVLQFVDVDFVVVVPAAAAVIGFAIHFVAADVILFLVVPVVDALVEFVQFVDGYIYYLW